MSRNYRFTFHDATVSVGNGLAWSLQNHDHNPGGGRVAAKVRLWVIGAVSTALTFTVQGSPDGTNWLDIGAATTDLDNPGTGVKTTIIDPLLVSHMRVVSAGATPGTYTVIGELGLA